MKNIKITQGGYKNSPSESSESISLISIQEKYKDDPDLKLYSTLIKIEFIIITV